MNLQTDNLTNANQQDIAARKQAAESACREMEMIFADALLYEIDNVQLHIQHLQNDISLLQTAENALDLLTENFAKIRRLVIEKQTCSADHATTVALNDDIRNLLMVNTLIAEDTVLCGHYLFRDDIIPMTGCGDGSLTLITTRIPEIAGIDNNDTQTTLDSLNNAARTINRQYQRVSSLMVALLDHYQQQLNEINLLLTAKINLQRAN